MSFPFLRSPNGIEFDLPFSGLCTFEGQYKGRTYRFHAQTELVTGLFPDITAEDLSPESHVFAAQTLSEYIIRWHASVIDDFFRERKNSTLSTYSRMWMLSYNLQEGKATLEEPKKLDLLCFHGIEYHGPRLPIYDPEDIYVDKINVDYDFTWYLVRIGGAQFQFEIPDLLDLDEQAFHEHLTREVRMMVEGTLPSQPQVKALVGFQKNRRQYVVGLLYEHMPGIPLSELSVPSSLWPTIHARIQKAYEDIASTNIRWYLRGPEDIIVREDGHVLFEESVFHRECTAGENPLIVMRPSLERLMSFFPKPPGSDLRRSMRISHTRGWTIDRTNRQQSLTLMGLPAELRLMIYQYCLICPGRLIWAGFLYTWISEEHFPKLVFENWYDDGLPSVDRDARCFLFANNNFFVDVARLYNFLKWSSFTSKIKRITLSVHAGRLDGGEERWREGIQELVKNCQELRAVDLVIYGKHKINHFDSWLEKHEVLHELRRVCKEHISKFWYRKFGRGFSYRRNGSVLEAIRVGSTVYDWMKL